MPTYSIKAPDGRTYTIQGPAGATDAQIRAEVLRQFPDAGGKPQQSFSQAVFGKMGRDLVGMMNPALTPIVGPTIDRLLGPNTVRDFTQRAVQAPTLGAADEVVSAVPAVAAARRGQSPKQAASQSQRQQSQERQRIQRERPNLALAADLTGGALSMAIPVPFAGSAIGAAPTLAQAALRTGGVGALQGGVTGFLGADEGERLGGAGMGAVTGGAVGAAFPYAVAAGGNALERVMPIVQGLMQRAAPMVEGVGRAIPAVDDLAGNVAAGMRRMAPPPPPNLPTPEQIALRHLSKTLQSSGLSLDDLRNAPAGITAAEAMGPTGRRQIGALARMDGDTGKELEALVAGRASGRMGNLQDAFAEATGQNPDAVEGKMEALLLAGRAKAAPLYDAAYNDSLEMTPTLREIVQRPAVQKGLREAREQMLNAGLNPDAQGLVVDPTSGDIPIIRITKQPSVQVLDYAKRSIDDEVSSLIENGRVTKPNKANALIQTAGELRNELTRQSDNYRKALETSGEYLQVNAAFKDAPKMLFNGKESPRALAQRLSKMTDSEREALKAGVANHALTLVNTGKMKPGLFSAQGVQQKLRILLGDEQADKLIQTAEVEGLKAAFERRYAPDSGSGTQPFLQGSKEIDESAGAAVDWGTAVMDTLTNPVGALKTGGASLINYGVDRMTQPGQIAARDAIGRLFLDDPKKLAAYLEANPVNVPPPVFPGPRAPNPFTGFAVPPRPSSPRRP